MTKYRTFIALKIKPSDSLIKLLNEGQNAFGKDSVKWVGADNLHLTLKFLGDTSKDQIESVKEVLSKLSNNFNPFHFHLDGLGYFKNGGHPKVLFVGIAGVDEMKKYVTELEDSLEILGFQKEKRPFKPHLTLGRIKFIRDISRFYDWIDINKSFKFSDVIVNEVTFYQSILTSDGPVYKSIFKCKL